MLGLLEGKVVKQVPGLDLCQEQAKDQELNSAGTELKIRFVIEISYGSKCQISNQEPVHSC